MKKSDLIYARKEFLNLPGQESIACIVTHIKRGDWGQKNDLYRNSEYELTITDCADQAKLNLEHDTEYDRSNSLHKIDTLISVLTDFRTEVAKEFEIQADLEAKRKAKKEKDEAEQNAKKLEEEKQLEKEK